MNSLPKWLEDLIHLHENHPNNKCGCECYDGGKGYCLAGEYLQGSLNAQEFMQERELID